MVKGLVTTLAGDRLQWLEYQPPRGLSTARVSIVLFFGVIF